MKRYMVKFTRKKHLVYSTIVEDAENKNHAVCIAMDKCTPGMFLNCGSNLKMKAHKIK